MLKHLITEYSDAIRGIIGTLLLIALVVILLASDGPAMESFKTMITNFFSRANTAAGLFISL